MQPSTIPSMILRIDDSHVYRNSVADMTAITDENHVGLKFGRLTIKKIVHCKPNKKCEVICDCGKELVVVVSSLKTGNTKSCGCFNMERILQRNFKHGQSGGLQRKRTKEYICYVNMINRCTKPTDKAWEHYGGRGIKVCDRWLESFSNFFEDMGKCPESFSLHRSPNETANYEPKSCSWSDVKVQARDRSTTHYVLLDGVKMPIAEATEKLGCSHSRIGVTFKRKGTRIYLLGHEIVSLKQP